MSHVTHCPFKLQNLTGKLTRWF